MLLYHIIILAVIQGLTEFLPISSSGHLALAHHFMDQDLPLSNNTKLLLDISVHIGTLFAVLLYFRKDIWMMIKGISTAIKNPENDGFELLAKITLASLPVIIVGFIVDRFFPGIFYDNVNLIGWTTLIFGIVLWLADKYGPTTKTIESLSLFHAFLIGLSQILALIPGVSRSGITMTAGRALGLDAAQAARFSLLLAIVAISGAGTLAGLDIAKQQDIALTKDIFWAIGLSFITGLASIALMLKWLEKHGFGVFVIYRILLGLTLIFLF
jgi:undecaprenyl-diphosphatase